MAVTKALKISNRTGSPFTKTLPVNIDIVHDLIEEDPLITYDKIEAKISLSRGTVHTIIHEYMKLHKITSRWVPHDSPKKK